ncbi:sensor domain-containing diguanylate cyclase [Marinobacter salicampi]|uniref:sensor domain-containing diguanylate cyclase n=1 Tax=Marinobacter salicampi TaxID=435907 RepID=UPI00140B1520|nr:diguanylate cyclase [Marinobacter salicampi]
MLEYIGHGLVAMFHGVIGMGIIKSNLRTRISLLFGGLTIALTALVVIFASSLATSELRQRLGMNFQELSIQLRDSLERQLEERYLDMAIAAKMATTLVEDRRFDRMTPVLDELKANFREYAWIGFALPDGRVVASTGDLLLGESVAARPWFQQALAGPFLGDVHKATLLEQLLNPGGGEPLRFIDVAVPMTASDGELLGVMGAHLDVRWIADLADSFMEPHQSRLQADLLVVNEAGEQIANTGGGAIQTTGMPQTMAEAEAAQSGFLIETLPDDEAYLVGFSRLRDDPRYSGLNWVVMVHTPVEKAFAEAQDLRNTILLAGLIIAVVFCVLAWLTARWVARPLLKVAQEVTELEARERSDIRLRTDFSEVYTLTGALRRLLGNLVAKEKELTSLNADLEQRVEARTSEIRSINDALLDEIRQKDLLRQEREALIKQLEHSANTDALTGIANRRRFFASGLMALRRSARNGRPVSVLLFDADHFKQINDSYGHGIGDDALRHLVALAQRALRDIDHLARIGGEEFVVLLEDTGPAQASAVAERLRALVESEPLRTGRYTIPLTVSIGVVTVSANQIPELEVLLASADRALYQAKSGGRNRVVLVSAQGDEPG